VRNRLLGVVREAAGGLGFEPRLTFDGPVDTIVSEAQAVALVASAREALSNVVRHAEAHRVEVDVVAGRDIVLSIVDDGVGFEPEAAVEGHGLRNVQRRAASLGGACTFRARSGGGTVVEWRVPADGP
jgi:signal transduction histidine kinase